MNNHYYKYFNIEHLKMTVTTRSQRKQNESLQQTGVIDNTTLGTNNKHHSEIKQVKQPQEKVRTNYDYSWEIRLNGMRSDLEERVNRSAHHHQRVEANTKLQQFNNKYEPYNRWNNAFM